MFRRAIQSRKKQWDNEREIELLLGGEPELEIEDWAALEDREGDMGYLSDLFMQLGERVPDWVAEAVAQEIAHANAIHQEVET